MKTSSTGRPQPPQLEASLAWPGAAGPASGAADRPAVARPNPALAGLALAVVAGPVAIVRLADGYHLPMPFCGLRRLTGLPCPGCGTTRSLLAWANFQPLEALRLNPLLFCLMIGLAVWAVAQLSDRFLGTRFRAILPAVQKKSWLLRLILGLAALNWVYLCLTLPK